jgi:hypothetical protein
MASRWLKLWTASAFAVALLPELGCQARRLNPAIQTVQQNQKSAVVARNHAVPETRIARWSSTPAAHVFRGSVSAISDPADLTGQ